MAMKSSFKNMTLCLLAICFVCSALLAGVYALTKRPIDAAAAEKLNRAIMEVLPQFNGEPVKDVVEAGGKKNTYYTVYRDTLIVGYAIQVSSAGFGGALNLMVGMTPDGEIYNTSVLSHSETPGLGAKCDDRESGFRRQFEKFNPFRKILKVRKDGGDVDAITASTITSRAYCAALANAAESFNAITGGVPVLLYGDEAVEGLDGISGASNN